MPNWDESALVHSREEKLKSPLLPVLVLSLYCLQIRLKLRPHLLLSADQDWKRIWGCCDCVTVIKKSAFTKPKRSTKPFRATRATFPFRGSNPGALSAAQKAPRDTRRSKSLCTCMCAHAHVHGHTVMNRSVSDFTSKKVKLTSEML